MLRTTSALAVLLLAAAGAHASTIDYTTSAAGVFSGWTVIEYDALLGLATPPPIPGPTTTRTSTPGSNTLGATASSASTSGGWVSSGIPITAAASASSNLATGTLQVMSSGSFAARPNLPPTGGDGFSLAVMQDILTFSNNTSQTQQVQATFQFTGSESGTSTTPFSVLNQFCLGPGTLCLSTSNPPVGYGQITRPDNYINIGLQPPFFPTLAVPYSFSFGDDTGTPGASLPQYWMGTGNPLFTPGANPYSGTYQLTLTLNPGQNSFSFFADLEQFCALVTCSTSGAVSFSPLPGGVTLTSNSGVFLSGGPTTPQPSASPEPATWISIVGGLAIIAALARRRVEV